MAKKNPFESFKNRYAGTDAVTGKLTAKAVDQMGQAYESLYNSIYKELSTARKDVNYATYAKQSQLLKQVGIELDKFKTRSGSYLMGALKKIAEYGTEVSIKDLELMAGGATKSEDWHYKYNVNYVKQTFDDTFEHIAARTANISTAVKSQLRSDSAMIMRRAAVEGWTRKKAHKELQGQIDKSMPSFEFIDKAGRRWGTQNYLNMLTHTVMSNTLNEVYSNTLINEGQDLVRVSRSGAKDACLKWEGEVLSLTGATPGYTTVAEARDTKEVFHPRCRHRLVVYNPDMEDVFKQVDQGASDNEILGFDLDEYLSTTPTEKAHQKLNSLPLDKDTGEPLNPMPLASEIYNKKIETGLNFFNEQGVVVEKKPMSVPMSDIKVSYPLVKPDMVKKYIDEPSGITGGSSIEAIKVNNKYVLKSCQMKALAAKLLGEKELGVIVHDYDLAYKKATKKKKLTEEEAAKQAALKKVEEEKAAAKAKQDAKEEAEKQALAKVKKEAKQSEEEKHKLAEKEKADFIAKAKESDFERIGPQQGSNQGGLFQHKTTGAKYYIKVPGGDDNDLKVMSEIAASKLYKLVGGEVPNLYKITMDDGKRAVVSEWADDLKEPKLTKAGKKKLQREFGADAWLANWDVAGLSFDNIAIKGTKAFRIDVGGALLYRAQGGLKGSAFGPEVTELETLRDSSMNPQSAKIFGDMSDEDIRKSLGRVARISDAQLKRTLAAAGFSETGTGSLFDTLRQRRNHIREKVKKLKAGGETGVFQLDNVVERYTWAHKEPSASDVSTFKASKVYSYGKSNSAKIGKCQKQFPSLTREEAIAYIAYTNGHYAYLNSKLRQAHLMEEIESTELVAYARILNNAIKKAMAHKGSMAKSKGRAAGPWEKAKAEYYERRSDIGDSEIKKKFLKYYGAVGNQTYIDSFLSVSREKTAFSGRICMYFKPKHGYPYCDKFSAHSGEDEVIVPVGVKVEVEHVMEQHGNTILYLKEI